ncbi:hypothetical protein PFISCL1PPCAC_26518, partial [Pristionchus fissidentatus]
RPAERTINACANGKSCSISQILENSVHVECDDSILYMKMVGSGPGEAMKGKLTCYDGIWHGTKKDGTTTSATNVYVACLETCTEPHDGTSICTAKQS